MCCDLGAVQVQSIHLVIAPLYISHVQEPRRPLGLLGTLRAGSKDFSL